MDDMHEDHLTRQLVGGVDVDDVASVTLDILPSSTYRIKIDDRQLLATLLDALRNANRMPETYTLWDKYDHIRIHLRTTNAKARPRTLYIEIREGLGPDFDRWVTTFGPYLRDKAKAIAEGAYGEVKGVDVVGWDGKRSSVRKRQIPGFLRELASLDHRAFNPYFGDSDSFSAVELRLSDDSQHLVIILPPSLEPESDFPSIDGVPAPFPPWPPILWNTCSSTRKRYTRVKEACYARMEQCR